jgi:hypothetical protein
MSFSPWGTFVNALITEGFHFLADSFTQVICIVAGESFSYCFWIAQKINLSLGVRDEIGLFVDIDFSPRIYVSNANQMSNQSSSTRLSRTYAESSRLSAANT